MGLTPESVRTQKFVRGRGCAACKNRGYSGRIAVVEMMPFTGGLRDLMAHNQPANELRKLALAEGMKPLRQSGLEKALEGITTLEEVLRVCLRDD